MLDESFLNLQITLLLTLGTIIFIFVSFKRRDLIIYLPPYLILPIGYLFIYLQIHDSAFRLIGNLLFLIGVLAFIFAIYYEYFKTIKKTHSTTSNNPKNSKIILSLSPITYLIIGIQIIFSILVLIAIIMVIKLFLMKKSTKHATLILFLTSALLTAVSTILSYFPLPGMWEFSFVAMIILSAIYFMFPILIFLEEKLVKSKFKERESEGRFRALFKGSPVPTLTWKKVDEDFQLVDYNKALREYSQDNIKNYLDVNASEFFRNRPDILKDLHRCFNKKINITREIKYYVNFLKEERDISAKLAYIPPDLVLLHLEDITERNESVGKIKESEEKFRTITEQSFMGIVIIQDGDIKYINGVLSRIMEYSLQEIRKWSSKDFFKTIHPEDFTIAMKKFQRMQTGRIGTLGSYLYRIFTKSRTIKWIDINSKVIQYQGKSAILVTLVDVTTKKEAEQLIIEENKKLVELDNLRKELITRISHELRTPLTSMYAASQILLRSNKEDPIEKILPYIEISHHGSVRLKELIENLLDTSRIENKKFELRYSNENINVIINDCVKELNYLADNRQITLNVNLTTDVYFELDKYRFPQVIINILSNAIKNTPPKGMVFLNLNETNEYMDIIIKDTGVGLTGEEKKKLFQKFGKIERFGMNLDVDIEGAGLGLYISKEIVELHGGEILVESEGRHKGSTFIIRLNKGVDKFQ